MTEQADSTKKKGKVVYIRKINKETGKMEDIPYYVDGDDVYAIHKTDEKTGKSAPAVKPVE